VALYHRALGKHPGVVRHLGVRLPVRLQAAGPVAERAARLLRSSPRFEVVDHDGLWLSLQSDGRRARGCLGHAQGTQLGCAEVTLDSKDVARGARRLAEEVHERLFAAKVDLTQSDLRSLDGSPAVGSGRAALKVRDLLQEIAPAPRR
jgi:hypothetical protein